MALISRKPARQESGEPTKSESDPTGEVEVTIEGPDAERLRGLMDMAAIAATLKRRAAGGTPPSDT